MTSTAAPAPSSSCNAASSARPKRSATHPRISRGARRIRVRSLGSSGWRGSSQIATRSSSTRVCNRASVAAHTSPANRTDVPAGDRHGRAPWARPPCAWSRARVLSTRALDCGARSSYRLRGDDLDPRLVGCRGGFRRSRGRGGPALVRGLTSGGSPPSHNLCRRGLYGLQARGRQAAARNFGAIDAHTRAASSSSLGAARCSPSSSRPEPARPESGSRRLAGSLVGAVKRRQATLARRPVHGVSRGTRPRSSNTCAKPAAPCARSQAYADSRYSQIDKPHCLTRRVRRRGRRSRPRGRSAGTRPTST